MDNIFSDMAQMMDALTEPFGDYAPRRRHLLADYKDKEGQDYHQELMTWHSPNATDKTLVESVKAEVARMGFTLSALLEYQDGGKVAALYIAPGYLEETAKELGRPIPKDIPAALEAAGLHPVNMEELKHGG